MAWHNAWPLILGAALAGPAAAQDETARDQLAGAAAEACPKGVAEPADPASDAHLLWVFGQQKCRRWQFVTPDAKPGTPPPGTPPPGTDAAALEVLKALVTGAPSPPEPPEPPVGAAVPDLPEATPGVQPVALPAEIQINVEIQFDFDSTILKPSETPKLAQLCGAMQAAQDVKLFQIIGHTDARGSAEYNQQLSQLRADEVRRFFIARCAIAPARLQALGAGERLPVDAAHPEAAENRRVEFQAVS